MSEICTVKKKVASLISLFSKLIRVNTARLGSNIRVYISFYASFSTMNMVHDLHKDSKQNNLTNWF